MAATAIPLLTEDLATDDNVERLARILMSEASVGNDIERTAVAWSVRNRMVANQRDSVRDVERAYATNQAPNEGMRQIAREVLSIDRLDPTAGATHYYSPRGMPREADDTAGFDVGGGLEQTPGLGSRNYRPGWAATYIYVRVAGVREAYFKFYWAPFGVRIR